MLDFKVLTLYDVIYKTDFHIALLVTCQHFSVHNQVPMFSTQPGTYVQYSTRYLCSVHNQVPMFSTQPGTYVQYSTRYLCSVHNQVPMFLPYSK